MSPAGLRRAAGFLALLALVVLLLSLAVSAALLREAALVQRIEPAASAGALFGDAAGPGTPIGSPQPLIVRDRAAFLPGRSETGARLVSEAYLRENGVYPLQVKTVQVTRNLLAGAAAAAFLLFGGVWLWAGRRGQGLPTA